MAISDYEFKNAHVGWYHDQNNWLDLEEYFRLIDRLAATGYTGVTYRYNVDVAETGLVLNSLNQTNLGRIVEYTQSIGLDVNLLVNWVYEGTQEIVGTGWPSVRAGFDPDLFLAGVEDYFRKNTQGISSLNPDVLYVGFENYPFVTEKYETQWAQIIEVIRSDYSGLISYLSDTNWWPIDNVGIWPLVDLIGVLLNPEMTEVIGGEAPSSVIEVEQWYFETPTEQRNVVRELIELSSEHSKPLTIDAWFSNFDEALSGNTDPVYSGHSLDNPLPVNKEAAKIAFQATLDVINKNLSSVVHGIAIGEYDWWVFDKIPENWTPDDSVSPEDAYLQSTWINYVPWANEGAEQAIQEFLRADKSFRLYDETTGSPGDDLLVFEFGNNMVIDSGGSDFIQGGYGVDIVSYDSTKSNFMVSDEITEVGDDSLRSVERLEFTDIKIAIDLEGSAGQTAKTLAAVIGEEGLSNKEYVGIGLSLFDAGQSLATVCELALNVVGVTTNEDVVTTLYTNLYGESPSDDQLQEYVELLDQGVFTKGSLAAAAAELTDDLGVIDLVGLAETGIEYI